MAKRSSQLIGLCFNSNNENPSELLNLSNKLGFSFIVLSPFYLGEANSPPFISDAKLTSLQWRNNVVLSIATTSEIIFHKQISFALHISVQAVIIPFSNKDLNLFSKLIRHVVNKLNQTSNGFRIWIQINYWDTSAYSDWLKLSQSIAFSEHVKVLLDFSTLEPNPVARNTLEKWIAEPLESCCFPCSAFSKNSSGLPVLPQFVRGLFHKLFKYNVQPLLIHDESINVSSTKLCLEYLEKLHERVVQAGLGYEVEEEEYLDYLQSPLQPLHDNLKNETYEVFEKDPVKYSQYETAIYKFLQSKKEKKLTCFVVGAGRGPLVQRLINACLSLRLSSKDIDIYVIEKNVNAIYTLQHLQAKKSNEGTDEKPFWNNLVILESDMRSLKKMIEVQQLENRVDLVVSELLGSFGDNELSPECLDPLNFFLNKQNGVSIPSSYTSFVQPITCPALWRKIHNLGLGRPSYRDTIYVVKLHKFYGLSDCKPCFTFSHPNENLTNKQNERFVSLEFKINSNGILHGFAGYFDTTLFEDLTLSIVPGDESIGMFSWFPCLMPLRTPLTVNKGDTVIFNIWRISSEEQVWYEWNLCCGLYVSEVQNVSGENYPIKLSTP
eukprot:maker-scaffold_7-snap-gene-18.44-mRNA-1 protein AED:0.00 eAED:0.00 QI:67/1/1/1/1/1/2/128/607